MLDKRVRVVAGSGMSAKLRKAIRSTGKVYGTIIGVFWKSNKCKVLLDKGIVIPEFSKPLACTQQHRIVVSMTNVREIK